MMIGSMGERDISESVFGVRWGAITDSACSALGLYVG